MLRADLVRQAQQRDVGAAGRLGGRHVLEAQVRASGQRRVHGAQRLADVIDRHHARQLDVGVNQQAADHLGAAVAGAADHDGLEALHGSARGEPQLRAACSCRRCTTGAGPGRTPGAAAVAGAAVLLARCRVVAEDRTDAVVGRCWDRTLPEGAASAQGQRGGQGAQASKATSCRDDGTVRGRCQGRPEGPERAEQRAKGGVTSATQGAKLDRTLIFREKADVALT